MRIHLRQRACGIAIIIVMICVTVLSLLAAMFAYKMKVETKLAQNSDAEVELYWAGRSKVEEIRWMLGTQLSIAQEKYDALNQVWAGGAGSINTTNSPLLDYDLKGAIGNATFPSITITDLERKANINGADQQMLERAFVLMGGDAGDGAALSSAILDWTDPDDNEHLNGAESDYYQGLVPPYLAKNAPMDDISELLLIKGVYPEIFWGGVATNHPGAHFQQNMPGRPGIRGGPPVYSIGLKDLFTALSRGRININTADATVLQLVPGIDESIAAEIIRLRGGPDMGEGNDDDTPVGSPLFGRPADLLVAAGMPNGLAGQVGDQYFDIRSYTFEVEIEAELHGYRRHFSAVLGRNSPTDVQVLTFSWK